MLNANDIPASIVEGEQSQFDVIDDEGPIFSKQEAGRFPEEDEILSLLR